jgi:peptide/nickel transport system permease protein
VHALTRTAGRLVQIVPTVFLVAVLMFGLMRLLPGDPALALLGDRATDAEIARLRTEMGFDQSIAVQFFDYVRNIATGNFGESIAMHVPVRDLILQRLPATLMLTVMATIIALLLAVPLAFVAAVREGGIVDNFLQDLYYLFLPSLTLAFSFAAILIRNLRDSIITVLNAEFVQFATAKGLRRSLVLSRHVLRNAMVSTVTLLGLQIGSLVGGAVITESVFAIPGVGRLMIDSIFARDYPVVQGLTIMLAVLVSLTFLAVDALQAVLDPRLDR